MKRLGFNIDQIVTSYKSLSLSLIDYAAPLLTSAESDIINALKQSHKRFLKIINCTPEIAKQKYNLLPPVEHIEKRCESILMRILNDKSHPTTKKLQKTNQENRTIHARATFPFEAPKPNNQRYNKSFVPKTLRTIRDNPLTRQQFAPKTSSPPPEPIKPKFPCNLCGVAFCKRGLPVHQRSCRKKNSETPAPADNS